MKSNCISGMLPYTQMSPQSILLFINILSTLSSPVNVYRRSHCLSSLLSISCHQIQPNSIRFAPLTDTIKPFSVRSASNPCSVGLSNTISLTHLLVKNSRTHFKVLSLTYNSLQYSQPTYLRNFLRFSPASQPALPDPPPV